MIEGISEFKFSQIKIGDIATTVYGSGRIIDKDVINNKITVKIGSYEQTMTRFSATNFVEASLVPYLSWIEKRKIIIECEVYDRMTRKEAADLHGFSYKLYPYVITKDDIEHFMNNYRSCILDNSFHQKEAYFTNEEEASWRFTDWNAKYRPHLDEIENEYEAMKQQILLYNKQHNIR